MKNGPEIVNFRPVPGVVLVLENRRLRPLGHLTAMRSLSIYDISVYEAGVVPTIVPESVAVGARNVANSSDFGL
jgi:hypothetical protein